jgi:hypothetical protein
MSSPVHTPTSDLADGHVLAVFHPGDLVTTSTGYPVLYEVLTVQDDGLLRVRGLNWAPGYSAIVDSADVRPVTGILQRRAGAG